MSEIRANNIQLGLDPNNPSNNLRIETPLTPDGSLNIVDGAGNSKIILTSDGRLGVNTTTFSESDSKLSVQGTIERPGFMTFGKNGTDIEQISGSILAFKMGSSAGNTTERMRLSSDGELLIGTQFLQAGQGKLSVFSPDKPAISLGRATQGSDSSPVRHSLAAHFGSASTINRRSAEIGFLNQNANRKQAGIYFAKADDNDTGGIVETMRMDAIGRLLIGRSDSISGSASRLVVQYSGTNSEFGQTLTTNATNGRVMNFLTSTTTSAGFIQVSGTSASYNTSSDYRLKENIVPLESALSRVSELNPLRFNFIGEEITVDGFLAHEAQSVVPESVTGSKDAVDEEGNPVYQGIDQSKLVPLLVAAVQELKSEKDELETKYNDLLSRVEALEGGA